MKFLPSLLYRQHQAPTSLSKFDLMQQRQRREKNIRWRFRFAMGCVLLAFGVVTLRLVDYGQTHWEIESRAAAPVNMTARPDIVDRNGVLLATDIKSYSLFAEPRRIIDADEVIERLTTVLPDLDWRSTYDRLRSKKGFSWVARNLTPAQKAQIMALGIPGIGFRTEMRRFYPSGSVTSHVLGQVNIDNQGIAGIEKYIDATGLSDLRAVGMNLPQALEPVKLALDVRVQTIVHEELQAGMKRYQAIAAGAVVLNVKTGEVVAMVSLPDFDPAKPAQAHDKDRLNRMSAGVFEMGSTIKSFTTAMALDSGLFTLETMLDASKPLYFGGKPINDYRGKKRPLSLREVFIYSSNIGSALEAEKVGIDGHREFLVRLGLLERMQTQLPEIAHPTEPKIWKKVHSATIAFGHGMSTTPLQTASGVAALMNGGKLINPSFLPRNQAQANLEARQVIKAQTSQTMRYLYRLNAEIGSGRRAAVKGYRVGGKTGTAEKVVNGRYSSEKRFNAFIAAFPMDDPTYVVLTIIDEPKPEQGVGAATAGLNAAPMTANIIRRTATFLGIEPDLHAESIAAAALEQSAVQ